jgi:hypothetical protein
LGGGRGSADELEQRFCPSILDEEETREGLNLDGCRIHFALNFFSHETSCSSPAMLRLDGRCGLRLARFAHLRPLLNFTLFFFFSFNCICKLHPQVLTHSLKPLSSSPPTNHASQLEYTVSQ